MDPQSTSFTPQQHDFWRLSSNVHRVQEIQQDHADRIARLERRQEEDSRLKSVWGTPSFPPVIGSGTPQQGPAERSTNVDFSTFDDDHSTSMIRSLHLDAEDEPRRLGAVSRANSVRFDESANQGQWSHTARSSMDLPPRSGSGLGGLGHPLFERSASHKSDGRHSSTGQSAISGRANSLGLDVLSPLGPTPSDAPGIAPGLFILGTVPSIIRCWMTTDFKHETLLYAAVCTGSYRSFLDIRLIEQLGVASNIKQDINGNRKIQVPVYLPEAVPQPTSSRPSSPSNQLPFITVDFTVLDRSESEPDSKVIQIFFGSDTLRAHSADILFSTNQMTLYDDSRNKLAVPFVRPENDETFKSLSIAFDTSTEGKRFPGSRPQVKTFEDKALLNQVPNGMIAADYVNGVTVTAPNETSLPQGTVRNEGRTPLSESQSQSQSQSRGQSATRGASVSERSAEERKPTLTAINTSRTEAKDTGDGSPPVTAGSARTSSSPAIWNNWRRDSSTQPASTTQGDWASVSRGSGGSGTFNRPNREQGIKVLKPISRQTSRTVTTPAVPSPSAGQSRFFDEGKRREGEGMDAPSQLRRAPSGELSRSTTKDGATSGGSKTKSANPVGGASAFGWLNSSGQQQHRS